MDRNQAIQLKRIYRDLPINRPEQERLISLVYGEKLRGRSLTQCSGKQIAAVAQRLYKQAHNYDLSFKVSPEMIDSCRQNWEKTLNDLCGNQPHEFGRDDISKMEKYLGLD